MDAAISSERLGGIGVCGQCPGEGGCDGRCREGQRMNLQTPDMGRSTPAARGLRTHAELGTHKPHGERMRYMAGCRCDACRAANTRYESERQRARKAGDWNGIVSAAAAREHILRLRRRNVGRRAIVAATDIADTIVQEIAAGKRLRIRARTERLILAVNAAARSDQSLVPASRTWRLIRELLDEEYTEAFIATRLGFVNRYLQFGRERVTARTAYRVERLHRELTT